MGVLQNYIRAAALSGKKRGRHPILNAQQFYPRALERELEQKTVAEFLRIFEELKAQASVGFASVQDDTMDLINATPELSPQFVNEVKRIGTRIDTQTHTNYSKQLELTIGAPYYPPGTPETILNEWHATFQELCVSATTQGKTNIAYLTAKAKQDGWNKQQLEKEIEKQLLPQFRHRAELIARTETAKLNSRCTLETYKSTGVEYYKWLTTLDERARASHHAMNGKICSVSDSEVYFEENPDNPLAPIKHTRSGAMYHGHPGTDFQCRCSMVMWDPELDGTFEVKEEHRIEQEEKEKSKEQEAEERIKQAEAEKEQAKQEAEQAKAEAETAKQEKEQAEKEKEKIEAQAKEAEILTKQLEVELKKVQEVIQAEIQNAKGIEAERAKNELEAKTLPNTKHTRYKPNPQKERVRAKEALKKATEKFPEEEFKTIKKNKFYISSTRLQQSKFKKEKEKLAAEREISVKLFNKGHAVVLLPEINSNISNPDAVVDGVITEFKTCNIKTITRRFLKAYTQSNKCIVIHLKPHDNVRFAQVLGKLKPHFKGRKGKLIVIIENSLYITRFNGKDYSSEIIDKKR